MTFGRIVSRLALATLCGSLLVSFAAPAAKNEWSGSLFDESQQPDDLLFEREPLLLDLITV